METSDLLVRWNLLGKWKEFNLLFLSNYPYPASIMHAICKLNLILNYYIISYISFCESYIFTEHPF